ncbi:unnamed protein product [Sympodiomycopsis kandeliae]
MISIRISSLGDPILPSYHQATGHRPITLHPLRRTTPFTADLNDVPSLASRTDFNGPFTDFDGVRNLSRPQNESQTQRSSPSPRVEKKSTHRKQACKIICAWIVVGAILITAVALAFHFGMPKAKPKPKTGIDGYFECESKCRADL